MMTQYLLVTIINTEKAFKAIKKRLKELDYYRFTALDSMGSTELLGDMEFSSMFAKSISQDSERKYNKTIFIVVHSEEAVQKLMDEIEAITPLEKDKAGRGIMFTIPVITSHGIRFNEASPLEEGTDY